MFSGTFTHPPVSDMLEVYDTARRQRLRPGKRAQAPEENDYHDRDRADRRRCGLVESLLARDAGSSEVFRRATEAGLQHGLRRLDAGSGLEAASRQASEISV